MRRRNPHLAAALATTGLTCKAAAHKAQIHPVTFSRILNMRQACTPQTAAAIAEALDSTPSHLDLSVWQRGGLNSAS